jgi:uncharacterized membrane protein YesL
MIGGRAFWLALRAVWEEFFILIMTALGTFLSVVLVVLAPLTLMGNYTLAQRIADERVVSWQDWWEGGRRHWRVAYLWVGLNLLVVGLFVFNMNFYVNQMAPPLGPVIAGVWLTALFLWLSTQLYVMPFYLMQEDQRLRVALKNAALLAFTDPLSTVALMVLSMLLVFGVYVIAWPLLVLLPPFLALAGTYATRLRLIRDGVWQPEDPKAPRQGSTPHSR